MIEESWRLICLCEDVLLDVHLEYQEDVRCVWRDLKTMKINLVLEKEDGWWIKDGTALGLEPQPFLPQTLYPCIIQNKKALLYCEELMDGDADYEIHELPITDVITIGRNQCDLQYQSKHISKFHAQLIYDKNTWWIVDMDSGNGIYVNRRRCRKQSLQFGDRIYIMGLQIIIGKGWFAFNHPQNKVRYRKGNIVKPSFYMHTKQLEQSFDTLYLQPKKVSPFVFTKREIEDPPPRKQQSQLPLALTLGPSFTMGLASMSTALFSLQQAIANNLALTSVYPTLIMASSMMAGTILWPILIRTYEKRKDHEHEEKRQRLYHQYLKNEQKDIEQELHRYESWLWLFHKEDVSNVIKQPEKLWNYVPLNQEIICIGCAEQRVVLPLQYQKQRLTMEIDVLYEQKQSFIQRTQSIQSAPLFLTLSKHSLINVNGNESQLLAYAMYLILHVCLLYPPQHILLVFAMSTIAALPASFRILPHLFDKQGNRYLCTNQKDAQRMMMRMHKEHKHVLIFSFSSIFTTLFHYDLEHRSQQTLFAFHELDRQMMCDDVIQLRDYDGRWMHKGVTQAFTWTLLSDAKQLAIFLARLPIADPSIAQFPKELDFLQLFHVEKVAHLQVYQRWQDRNSEHTVSAVLGVDERNEPISLDLHEKAHGPHGIIAGMTGSGKSELLITLILSLAVSYHPYDVSFILIDYKGGGMAKAFEQLPHIAGIITNLDGSMIQRSLNSLNSELLRRQTIFSDTMKLLTHTSMDIYMYQKLFHEGVVQEPLPHLVIVADEFAELKQQQPQFMEQLIRTARIGRSLGVHLLLATQKPSGVVDDQIWSNARFHICLKVAEKADSMDMLKREDGALLSDTGRFYLQVGYNEIFHQGQSAYTKTIYQPDGKQQEAYIRQLDMDASILSEWKRPSSLVQKETQLQAVISHLQSLANEHALQVRQLWLPILASEIEVSLSQGCIAMIDDPTAQAQYPLCITMDSFTSAIAYGMNLREIEDLFTVTCYQLMYAYTPQELSIVIFDFEQNRLSTLQAFPHVYACVSEEDEEDIQFLYTYLKKEIKERKKQAKPCRLLLILHHIAAFLEANEAYEGLLYKLLRDGERYGIYVWMSATTLQDVRFRLHQQCSQFFLFRMHDEQDIMSILNTRMMLPNIFGRAIWKKQEQVYEIQTVNVKKAKLTAFKEQVQKQPVLAKLFALPEHIYVKDIWHVYDDKRPWMLPIGIRQEDRSIHVIDLRKTWLVLGSGAYAFMNVLQTLPIPIHILPNPNQDNTIEDTAGFLHIATTSLSTYMYTPWFQKLSMQNSILWIGDGLQDIRYLLDISKQPPLCSGMNGVLLDNELTRIRFMEEQI